MAATGVLAARGDWNRRRSQGVRLGPAGFNERKCTCHRSSWWFDSQTSSTIRVIHRHDRSTASHD